MSIVPPSWATLFSSPSVARATPYALVGVDVDRSLSLSLSLAQGHSPGPWGEGDSRYQGWLPIQSVAKAMWWDRWRVA